MPTRIPGVSLLWEAYETDTILLLDDLNETKLELGD